MNDKIEIIIENMDWNERGNFNVWHVKVKKNGIEQFLGYDTMPEESPEKALKRATDILKF